MLCKIIIMIINEAITPVGGQVNDLACLSYPAVAGVDRLNVKRIRLHYHYGEQALKRPDRKEPRLGGGCSI